MQLNDLLYIKELNYTLVLLTGTMRCWQCNNFNNYSSFCSHLGRPNVATTLYDELLITLTDTYGDDSHYVAKALHLIGGSLTPHQKYDKSE